MKPVAWIEEDGMVRFDVRWASQMQGKEPIPLYTHPVKEKDRFPKNFWEDTSATLENIQRADYIFTHYAKSDIIALARDLDRRDAKVAHPVKEQDGCGNCHACLVGVTENGYLVTMQRMILCPDCGNKRCPKASNHRHQCTESNEPNQRGSIYTHPVKELTDEEIRAIHEQTDGNLNMIEFARAILRKAQEK